MQESINSKSTKKGGKCLVASYYLTLCLDKIHNEPRPVLSFGKVLINGKYSSHAWVRQGDRVINWCEIDKMYKWENKDQWEDKHRPQEVRGYTATRAQELSNELLSLDFDWPHP